MQNDQQNQPQQLPPQPLQPLEPHIENAYTEFPKQKRRKWPWILLVLVLLLAGGVGYWYYVTIYNAKPTTTQTVTQKPKAKLPGLQLDTSKDYGNKYADGVLPVGDGKYVTDKPKTGNVYACSQYAQSFANDKGGAGSRGPWFVNNNTQYDVAKKSKVLGSVTWQPSFSNTTSGTTRTIVTNDLPSHPTGVFPIAATDPAYNYDRNPNSIKDQSLTYALSTSPSYSTTPTCMGGEVGVMLTGVALFSAFDAGGRDAGAWEVQDDCGGHPQNQGEYHYHTLSSCIKDISVHTVLGYALDGYPITGPNVGTDNILITSDLDECHGITSAYFVNNKTVTGYHYVMTQDFPYSLSCFRSTPTPPPHSANAQQQPAAQPRP